jgi:hypothetical protein
LGLIAAIWTHQEWGAGLAFFALGRPIPGWTALNDVRDVHLFAAHPHRFDHVGQELSRAPDERFALLVFVRTRGLADKHQVRLWIAHTKDNLLASLRVKDATGAIAKVFADDPESLCRVTFGVLGPGSNDLKNVFVSRSGCGGTAWGHVVLGIESE